MGEANGTATNTKPTTTPSIPTLVPKNSLTGLTTTRDGPSTTEVALPEPPVVQLDNMSTTTLNGKAPGLEVLTPDTNTLSKRTETDGSFNRACLDSTSFDGDLSFN